MAGFTVTEKAWLKINELTAGKQIDTGEKLGLRIKVVGGGCSGFSYKLGLDIARAGDAKVEKDEIFAVVDQKTILYVKGMELDYQEDLMKSGFVFHNPNVKKSCGCGESFST